MACGAGAQRAARPLHIIGKSLTQAWKIDRCGSRGILVFPAASKDRSENPPSLWSWFSEHQICGDVAFTRFVQLELVGESITFRQGSIATGGIDNVGTRF